METLCPTSLVSNSSWFMHLGKSTWTKEENKRFENALAIFDEKTPDRWFKVAAMIPGKSVYDVIKWYTELEADVSDPCHWFGPNAIEFSEANIVTFPQLDPPDKFPLKFKIVQYGQKEHQHTKDQQGQHVSDGMDTVRSVAQAKRCSTAAANSKKEEAAKKIDRGKRKTGLHLNLEDLEPHFGKRLKDDAEELGVGRSAIKCTSRYYGIHRWPCNEKHKKNPSLFETESANEIAHNSQQNTCPSSSRNLLLSDMPLHQNVPQTNTESTQHLIVQPEAEKVIMKAKYEDDTVKFQLSLSSGMDKIAEEVARRLNLKIGSFKLKYLDEDNDEILLACDDDLHLCLKSLTAVGKTCIQVFVQLICK